MTWFSKPYRTESLFDKVKIVNQNEFWMVRFKYSLCFVIEKNNGCIYIKQNWTESYSIIRGAQNFCFVYQNEQIHEPATVVSYEKSGRVWNDTVWTLPVNSIISSDNWLRFRDDRNRKTAIFQNQHHKVSLSDSCCIIH